MVSVDCKEHPDERMIANTILQQLGGMRFIIMTGANNLVRGTNQKNGNVMITFKFPGFQLANYCTIELNVNDLYDIKFIKDNKKTFAFEEVKTIENVYFDQLQEVFTGYTGLRTRL